MTSITYFSSYYGIHDHSRNSEYDYYVKGNIAYTVITGLLLASLLLVNLASKQIRKTLV